MFSLTPWKRRQSRLPVLVEEDRPFEEWEPLARFRDELDSLMEDFFGSRIGERSRFSGWEPRRFGAWDLGFQERDDEYLIQAEIPGFEPEDIELKVSGNVLSVRAEHKEEKSGDGESSYRYGEYYRTVTLPQGIDPEKIDAKYHSGVLEIHLAKSPEVQGRRIKVKQA